MAAPSHMSFVRKKGETFYNVDNSAMTYMLINAVKEQQLMIDKQQQQIDELKKLVEKLAGKATELALTAQQKPKTLSLKK